MQLKRERPSWGAPKIREKLRRLHSDIPTPAISTVHAVLDRHGLVSRGRKRRYKAQDTPLSRPLRPNDLWCAGYKGELEATKPAAQNFLQQQAKFDDFLHCYNHERPHQALDMKYPAGGALT